LPLLLDTHYWVMKNETRVKLLSSIDHCFLAQIAKSVALILHEEMIGCDLQMSRLPSCPCRNPCCLHHRLQNRHHSSHLQGLYSCYRSFLSKKNEKGYYDLEY